MNNQEPTNADILGAVTVLATRMEHVESNTLEAIQDLAQSMDERFDHVEEDITTLKSDIAGLKSDASGLKSDVSGLKSDVVYLKMNMVTKAYLDEKLADQFSDIAQFVKRRVPGWVELGGA